MKTSYAVAVMGASTGTKARGSPSTSVVETRFSKPLFSAASRRAMCGATKGFSRSSVDAFGWKSTIARSSIDSRVGSSVPFVLVSSADEWIAKRERCEESDCGTKSSSGGESHVLRRIASPGCMRGYETHSWFADGYATEVSPSRVAYLTLTTTRSSGRVVRQSTNASGSRRTSESGHQRLTMATRSVMTSSRMVDDVAKSRNNALARGLPEFTE
mmetsp:Transcript_18569/g.74131  ORF Transcript_18569/g.74131 Transcript_18569/m.74131 type:complete len:215 (+) Transcript_18569:131-775(+)